MKILHQLSLTAMVLSVVLCSCNRQKNAAEQEQTTSASENAEIQYQAFHSQDSSLFSTTFVWAEYPVNGPQAYVDSVRKWIQSSLSYYPFGESDTVKIPPLQKKLDNGQAFTDYYAVHKMYTPTQEGEREWMKESQIQMSSYDSIYVSFRNQHLTSVSDINHSYMGGAHGSTTVNGMTFNNKTGKTYGWDMVADKKQLLVYIEQGLVDYFEASNVKSMKENLFPEAIENGLPLPQAEPFFTQDGLLVQYQQYEIAPYALGIPTVVIGWDKCKKILNKEILQMLQETINGQ
ncbi:MAG: DUF3298 domain-containing protein [Bacteroidales bacterium]|nr:DUF3298 domain-containing protein [Bacteroidales bacterium]